MLSEKIIGVLLGLQATKVKPSYSISSGSQHVGSLTEDELPQVGLGEAAELLQGIVLRHGQTADVRGQAAQRDEREVGWSVSPLLQSQDCAEDVAHTVS